MDQEDCINMELLEKKEGAKEEVTEEPEGEDCDLFCNILIWFGSFIMSLFLFMSGMHFTNLQFRIYGKVFYNLKRPPSWSGSHTNKGGLRRESY